MAVCASGAQGQQLFVPRAFRVSGESAPRHAERNDSRSSHPTADGSASGPTECSGGSRCLAAPPLTSAEHRCRVSQSGGHTTKSSTKNRPFRCGPFPPKVVSPRRSAPHARRGESIALHSELPGGRSARLFCRPFGLLSRNPLTKDRGAASDQCAEAPVTSHDICAPATGIRGCRFPVCRRRRLGALRPCGRARSRDSRHPEFFGRFSSVALSDSGMSPTCPPSESRRRNSSGWTAQATSLRFPGHAGTFSRFRLSPDGREVGVTFAEGAEGAQSSVWILDLERGTRRLSQKPTATGRFGAGMEPSSPTSRDVVEPTPCSETCGRDRQRGASR